MLNPEQALAEAEAARDQADRMTLALALRLGLTLTKSLSISDEEMRQLDRYRVYIIGGGSNRSVEILLSHALAS